MIVGAAFCPHPPLLVPELAGAAAEELADLRAECTAALRRLASRSPDRYLLLGAAPQAAVYPPGARGSLAGFGGSNDVAGQLPLSLTVGSWLLAEALDGQPANASAVAVDGTGPDLAGLVSDDRVGLVVLGDGTARRSERAPGYLDERAAGFDARVEAALRDGDAAALATLDPDLGAELLAAGVPAWRAAGALLAEGHYDAGLLYADDPYGVAYFVAVWLAGE